MLLIDSLAEKQIAAAIRRGELENLPGAGRPLLLDDDSTIPEALRVPYRILRNAGCLPPEWEMRKEIRQLESLLGQVEPDAEARTLRRRLCLLQARLALQGRDINLLAQEGAYRNRLLQRIAGAGGRVACK